MELQSIYSYIPSNIHKSISKAHVVDNIYRKNKDLDSPETRKTNSILNKLRIWSDLLKKSLMENFIFCAVHNCFEDQQFSQKVFM